MLMVLRQIVSHVTSEGGYAVLDPHDYLRYNGTVISSSECMHCSRTV
jgi:endoglucanase